MSNKNQIIIDVLKEAQNGMLDVDNYSIEWSEIALLLIRVGFIEIQQGELTPMVVSDEGHDFLWNLVQMKHSDIHGFDKLKKLEKKMDDLEHRIEESKLFRICG